MIHVLPENGVRSDRLFLAARLCRDGGRHRFPERPSWARLQPRAKSMLSEKSRLGNFFSEPVMRNHRAEREAGCVSEAI